LLGQPTSRLPGQPTGGRPSSTTSLLPLCTCPRLVPLVRDALALFRVCFTPSPLPFLLVLRHRLSRCPSACPCRACPPRPTRRRPAVPRMELSALTSGALLPAIVVAAIAIAAFLYIRSLSTIPMPPPGGHGANGGMPGGGGHAARAPPPPPPPRATPASSRRASWPTRRARRVPTCTLPSRRRLPCRRGGPAR